MSTKLVFLFKLSALSIISTQTTEAAGDGQNKQEAQALCNIYLQGTDLESYRNETLPSQIRQMLDEIERINMSVISDEHFNAKAIEPYSEEEQWNKRKQVFGSKFTTFDGVEYTFTRQNNKKTAFIASKKISRLLKQARRIEGDYERTRKNVNELLESAKTCMKEALYGTGNSEPVDATFSSDRAEGCGHTGTAGQPAEGSGKSLLNDLVCLCAHQGGSGVNTDGKACTDSSSALSTKSWGQTGRSTGQKAARTAWDTIKNLCRKSVGLLPTPGTIQSAVERYFTFIKAGTSNKGFVVGISDSNDGACAKTSQTDVACVAYPQEGAGATAAGTKGAPAIKWANQAFKAAKKLGEANVENANLKHLQAQLFALHQSAWNIYTDLEEDQDAGITGPGHPTQSSGQRQNSTTPSGKPTVQEPSGTSGASISRLIAPWALFI